MINNAIPAKLPIKLKILIPFKASQTKRSKITMEVIATTVEGRLLITLAFPVNNHIREMRMFCGFCAKYAILTDQ